MTTPIDLDRLEARARKRRISVEVTPQMLLAMIARIRELEAAQKWRPISEANIDAGKLLLWQERRGVQMGKFNKDEYAQKPRPFWAYDSDHRITHSRDSQPTHYMPLPPPPKMEE